MTATSDARRTESNAVQNTDSPSGENPRWRDRKRYLWPLGLLIPLSPFISWFLVDNLRLGLFWATGAWLLVIVIPIIDMLAGEDGESPPDDAIPGLQKDRYYRWCTYAFLPLQYAGLVFACWCWINAPMGIAEKIAMSFTVGVVAGVGINAAHELGHKSEKIEQWLAKVALAQSLYGHFYVEHNFGHHVRVATPQDPASSRFGESFWRFLPRSVFGGLRSAWRIESARLQRKGKRTWSFENNVLNAWAMSVVLFAALIGIFGWEVAPCFCCMQLPDSPSSKPRTTSSITACCVASALTARMYAAAPLTVGTAITS